MAQYNNYFDSKRNQKKNTENNYFKIDYWHKMMFLILN